MAPKKKTSAPAASEQKTLADLKLLDRATLSVELDSARRDLYILTMKKHLGELKQPHLLRAKRAYIAQISTFLTSSI
jgi:ribosomal protein L29